VDIDVLVAAGVYDPAAADASERLVVLQWLLDEGVTIDEIVAAERQGSLYRAGLDALLWPEGGGLTVAQVASEAGLSEASVRRVRRLVGLTDPGEEPVCHRGEVDLLRTLKFAIELFGEEQALQFVRVLGLATATMAEAAISMFAVSVAEPLRDAGGSDLEYARRVREATRSFSTARTAIDVMMRLHFDEAVDRLTGEWRDDERPRDVVTFSIAFVDLVDSTRLAVEHSPGEFAAAIRDFEGLATEGASAAGARVVKLLGDSAMIAAPSPVAVAHGALDTVARVGSDPRFEGARGGVATGEVSARGGDYFGPPVNLASRLTQEALPGEVLCDEATARALPDEARRLGTRDIRGLDTAVTVFEIGRVG
jgi:class 3 adenylate cyclase